MIYTNFKEKVMLKTVICILIKKILSWKSTGISNEKLEPPKDENSPKVLFEKTKPFLKISSFKFLAQ